PAPETSSGIIRVYSVRGVDTPSRRRGRVEIRAKIGRRGVSEMADRMITDHEGDGVDRRGFLKCMAWAGTGLVWTVTGGVLSSRAFGQGLDPSAAGGFS